MAAAASHVAARGPAPLCSRSAPGLCRHSHSQLTAGATRRTGHARPAACPQVPRNEGLSFSMSEDGPAPGTGPPLHADSPSSEPHPVKQRIEMVVRQFSAPATVDPQVSGISSTSGYWELLQGGEEELATTSGRARSAMDAGALRRKGHLKEQDRLIEFMLRMHETSSCLEVMTKMEAWIEEHRRNPLRSRLRRIVPGMGTFFTSLHLVQAFKEYDAVFSISKRKYIPPNFAEMRHILDIAQVYGSAPLLKLITFDADGTLYPDGHHFSQDNHMIDHIISLMLNDIDVAIVTAAAYPGDTEMFEGRLAGLLDAFRERRLPAEVTNRFHIMGGECNYLLRVTPDTKRLEFVPDDLWKSPAMKAWKEDDIQAMLRDALTILSDCSKRLGLQVEVVQKERCVGIIPHTPAMYEVLEDIALEVQNTLVTPLPFCAFNGGNDVFVDVGNKSLGLQCLMKYLGTQPQEVIHVGDRFTMSGNDAAARDVCCVLWVANPEETGFFVKLLLALRQPNSSM